MCQQIHLSNRSQYWSLSNNASIANSGRVQNKIIMVVVLPLIIIENPNKSVIVESQVGWHCHCCDEKYWNRAVEVNRVMSSPCSIVDGQDSLLSCRCRSCWLEMKQEAITTAAITAARGSSELKTRAHRRIEITGVLPQSRRHGRNCSCSQLK